MWKPWRDGEHFATGVGEQRLVLLQDGTRLTLNTSTDVYVVLSKAQRRVAVQRGEVLFEVAKDSNRPFVVSMDDTEVTATGTSFVVRVEPSNSSKSGSLDVTLVEGQVIVQGSGTSGITAALAKPVVMAAGQRIRLHPHGPEAVASPPASTGMQIDHPKLEQLLAWRRGEIVLDDVPLESAIAEMNRYSTVPIVLTGPPPATAPRVGGVFSTASSASFARAVAKLHGLRLTEFPDRLELQRP